MTYHREEAEKIIKINREQLNISDEQTALAYAINCGKGRRDGPSSPAVYEAKKFIWNI